MFTIEEKLAALRRYKEQYGRLWKSRLMDHWRNESKYYPKQNDDRPILRQARNSGGLYLINQI